MFKKENNPESFKKDAETIIGESIKVKGNFVGQGNIIVDGILEGSLKTKGSVFVGEKAKIIASIEAQEIVINGEISGNLLIKGCLTAGPNARIFGDIECSQISIDQGAMINGKCQMAGAKESAKTE